MERTQLPTKEPREKGCHNVPLLVGVGASAGGLEALELFLGNVPVESGLAFAVIQHLAPDQDASLPELLQRSTAMKVVQVRGTERVLPNHVYVIPPNKYMVLRNSSLYLCEPTERHGLRLPIDYFLHSMAEDCGEQSIGVILSGMGSDGTNGLRSIKGKGGLTLVQDPATAKFDSMPHSAIAAGLADIVAPADELPARIIELLGLPHQAKAEYAPSGDDLDILGTITALLKLKTGHDFSLYKTSSLYRRIERRMGIHKITSLFGYAKFLKKNSHEVELLFKELLIGVTSFFRDPAMWDNLRNIALPKLLQAYPEGGALRAWSCGCSTGEEAYSLAMLFQEALEQLDTRYSYSLQIFATDLDSAAIEKARKGCFAAAIESAVSPERLQRYFIKREDHYQVGKKIREMIVFAQQNVIMDPPFTKLDILMCRNLLIYLNADLQKKLLPIFHYSLKPGGLLFLGSAETVGPCNALFAPAAPPSKIFWRNETIGKMPVAFPITPFTRNSASLPQESYMSRVPDNIKSLADRLILQHFSVPTVIANDQGDIVYISGRTGKYLEPAVGKANLNIFAMVREGLRYELGCAFTKALQQNEPIIVKADLHGDTHITYHVELTVIKIDDPEIMRGMVMVAFRDIPSPSKKRRKLPWIQPDSARVEELEQELLKCQENLRTTREEMQTAHEELRSMNEELQSTNEELQSTNEELTTSKEEMQSINEELQTVNAEQAARLDDYMRINNDMENLLNSTEIVTVFLDNQLQVRRFTTGANRLFKLIPGDVGRPLTDIVSNFDYPQLYDHVQDVLRKLVSVENQVASLDGRWFLVRIMPYRTMEKMIDGVVITCNYITRSKKTEDELREEIARLKGQGS